MGACQLTCVSGFGNCDGDPSNGCETPLDTVDNCRSCGNACVFANATAACGAAGCEIASCDMNFENCDATLGNGCEADLLNARRTCGDCMTDCGGGNKCCNGMCQAASAVCP
jgi:hypothetical protein